MPILPRPRAKASRARVRRPATGFANWPPLAKLGLWGAIVLALPACATLAASWLGVGAELLDSAAGRNVLMAHALLTLIYIMAWDRRRMADYGIVINGHWGRQVLVGLAVGSVFYFGYYALATTLGVYHFHTDRISVTRVLVAALAAVSSLPLAIVQQLVFSGYLPNMLRDRHGRAFSIVVPSLIFGIFGGMAVGSVIQGSEGRNLAVGMFLIATLLCLVRMTLGSITFPVGLLAGAIMVRRVVKKLDFLAFDPTNDWSRWFAPEMDPRQGFVMWGLLVAATGIAAAILWRRGEPAIPDHQPALDASFKRVLPFSNLMALAPLDLWVRKLWEARGRVGLKYVPRLIVTLVVSTLNTLLSLPERWLAPRLMRHAAPDPIFIVGVHRSGTTHLHNLLAIDPQFSAPSTYQVFNPHGFLTGVLTSLFLGPLLTWRRPMDSVQMTVFSPQEEEFAMAAMSPHSPYWFGCFPKLFAAHERFIYPDRMEPAELATWRQQFKLFLQKLTFWTRKRPLLKSPYNTARVALLRDMFPRARFVHIARHPYAVYRSNMHLAEHGWAVFQLQDPDTHDSYADRFLTNYRDQEEAYYRDAAQLPAGQAVEVRFEDVERDPIAVVRQIYADLGLDFSFEFARRLRDYVASIENYQKNRFEPLEPDERQRIDDMMGPFIERWGYRAQDSGRTRAAA